MRGLVVVVSVYAIGAGVLAACWIVYQCAGLLS